MAIMFGPQVENKKCYQEDPMNDAQGIKKFAGLLMAGRSECAG